MSNLSLCWGSLDGVDFDTFLSSAAGAGFKSVTLNTALYLEAQSTGLSDRDISQSILNRGLSVSDIDPLFNWLPVPLHYQAEMLLVFVHKLALKMFFIWRMWQVQIW